MNKSIIVVIAAIALLSLQGCETLVALGEAEAAGNGYKSVFTPEERRALMNPTPMYLPMNMGAMNMGGSYSSSRPRVYHSQSIGGNMQLITPVKRW